MDSQDSSTHQQQQQQVHHHHQAQQFTNPPPPQPQQQPQQQQQQQQLHNSYANNNNSTTTSAAMMQHPRFPFNAAPKPVDHHYSDGSPSDAGGFGMEPARKKRGRPRKYSPDNNIGLGLSSPAPAMAQMVVDSGAGGTPSFDTPAKRNRGRPPGSGKKQLDALGTAGVGFTPHVIIARTGEDIASKIMAFSQQGPRSVCILSATGSISNVTLRQSAMSGGTVTYEGRFEIISLTGSFSMSETNANRGRTGSLSVSLAGSDGRVLGGGVAGMLKAATTVQIVVGSFIPDGKKSKSIPSSAPVPQMLNFGAPIAGDSAPSPADSSESSEENDGSPLNPGSGPNGNSGQPMQNIPIYSNMGWPNSNVKMFPN